MKAHSESLTDGLADFDRSTLLSADGTVLDMFAIGPSHAPKVVVVNPLGVPLLICSRLMRRLSARYRVVSWEQRGCNASRSEFFARPHDYAAFVADLVQVIESLNAKPCALIGVCSGAALAIRAIAERRIVVEPLVLVSPAVRFDSGYVTSVFDLAVVPYMQRISAGEPELAESILEMRSAAAPTTQYASEDERLAEAADKWGLRSLDSFHVYARTVSVFHGERMDMDFPRIRQKAFVLTAIDDQTVAAASVRRMVALLPNAELSEYATGGHFMILTRQDAQERVCEIIDHSHAADLPDARTQIADRRT
jgi:3-oxoadipate enol-lactonase